MSVVDQFSDPAFGVLYRLTGQMPNLEAFVKEASIESREAAELPATAFAWADERRYPVHTAEHAALSYAYLKTASEYVPPEVETRIKEALEVWGVPAETFASSEVKLAADTDEDFLLPDLRLLRVKSASDVTRAQNQLVGEIQKLDLEHRATACANLVKKAQEFEVELHPEVQKLAGFVVSSTRDLRDWLEARSVATPPSQLTIKQAYQELADEAARLPIMSKDRPTLLKLANTIATLDEKSGLDRHYDRSLPDALRTVFNTTKQAAAMVDLEGRLVPAERLAMLPASFWEDLGGQELADEVAPGGVVDPNRLATVVETLPLDLKRVLAAQLG